MATRKKDVSSFLANSCHTQFICIETLERVSYGHLGNASTILQLTDKMTKSMRSTDDFEYFFKWPLAISGINF